MVRAFAHGAMGRRIDPSWGGPIELFLVEPVLHDWCNKGRGMCYPVCGMVHIKEPLLLIGKSSPCGGSGFPLSLSEWFFTICPTPYNRKIKCVECVVKYNISFLPSFCYFTMHCIRASRSKFDRWRKRGVWRGMGGGGVEGYV